MVVGEAWLVVEGGTMSVEVDCDGGPWVGGADVVGALEGGMEVGLLEVVVGEAEGVVGGFEVVVVVVEEGSGVVVVECSVVVVELGGCVGEVVVES